MATPVNRRMRRRVLSIGLILAVAVLILLLRLVEEIGLERSPDDRFTVVRVIDGDTVELLGGDRLRLLAIDTPERGEAYHDEAAAMLERLALGRRGRIEFADRRRDRYGRLLGYLYIDSLFVNRAILDSGLGYVYLFKDNDLSASCIAELIEAQSGAIDRKVGLWSIPHEPEAYYVVRQGSFRLHRPNCESVRDLKPGEYVIFKTREEGLRAGYSPCRNCKP